MDFVFDNLIWLIAAAAGLVQWWKASQEAKEESRRNTPEYNAEELEEFLEQAERFHPRPAVPPPLPQAAPAASPPPLLRRREAEPPAASFDVLERNSAELERQVSLAEQMKLLKQAKQHRSLEESSMSAYQKRKPIEVSTSLRGRLLNRLELRQAFVLKEILEKPVGLR